MFLYLFILFLKHVGGFDLDIFFKEQLISYVERGGIFGYIGHSCRKKWVDKILSEICLPHIKAEDFAGWLTSTSGRHFGDSIEHLVEEDDVKAVENKIKEVLPAIHDKAIIFNHPDHKGTFSSTKEIFEKLKDAGMMMSESISWL